MADISEISKQKKRTLLQIILSSGFLASFSTALIVYVNSSFLATLMPERMVGIFFAISYFITMFVVQSYGVIIAKYKNHNVLLTSFALQVVCLLLLAVNVNEIVSILAFTVLIIMYNVTVINYDVLLEVITKPKETGRIRGIFWTAINLAYVIAPFVSGFLMAKFGFSVAYAVSAIILVPAWFMIYFAYRKNGEEKYRKHHSFETILRRVYTNKNLLGIFVSAFVLYFFYSWMVVYTPMYLLDIGFTWDKIGQIFTVMLIPFILIEYPAGWIADKYLGEVEMLALGFFIMCIAVFALLYVSTFWWVMIVLLISRVGAALVEIMRDTYFYKKVEADDLDLIDAFRNTRSLAYVVGPLLASVLISFGWPISSLFVILALILFAAIFVPFTIKDTK